MASVERRERGGVVRWYVRYRTPSGDQRTKSFVRKVDARQYLIGVEASKHEGVYVDPRRARMTCGEWASEWLGAQGRVRPSTRLRYEGVLQRHVLPRWGSTPLGAVDHVAVQQWVSGLELSPGSVRKVFLVFSRMMALAARDRRLVHDPTAAIELPKQPRREKRFLTREQLHQLAGAAGAYPLPEFGQVNRALVLVLGYCGLRWGEAAGLRVGRLDVTRGRLRVTHTLIEVGGRLVDSTPKTHQEREVPVPRFVVNELVPVVAGRRADELVFTTLRDRPLRNLNWRRDVFDRAAADVGLGGLTPHELRHTAASLAISVGANVKAVQRMLGHGSAAMTLDTYAGLFADDLEDVATRLDAAAGVYPMCTDASVSELHPRAN